MFENAQKCSNNWIVGNKCSHVECALYYNLLFILAQILRMNTRTCSNTPNTFERPEHVLSFEAVPACTSSRARSAPLRSACRSKLSATRVFAAKNMLRVYEYFQGVRRYCGCSIQNIQTIDNIDNMNYGNLIYNKSIL